MLNPHFRDMLFALHAERAEFLIVGSYAVAAYGGERATADIDIWVHSTRENAQRVMTALLRFGAPTAQLSLQDLLCEDLIFQMGVPPSRIDILTSIDAVTFDEAWAERNEWVIDELKVPVLSRRHLLVNKRAVGRTKDLADVERLENEPDNGKTS